MKKIYVFSFLGGFVLGVGGLWLGIISNALGGLYNSLTRDSFGDPMDVITAIIYFALLFLVWFSLSILFKRIFHLDKKKQQIVLFVGLAGISIVILLSILFFSYADIGFSV